MKMMSNESYMLKITILLSEISIKLRISLEIRKNFSKVLNKKFK